MKRGYIQPGKSASELMRIIKQFEQLDVSIGNITLNLSFDEFVKTVDNGDDIVVDSYTEIFGGLTDMLSRLIELSERGVRVESCSESSLFFDTENINMIKVVLSISNKVKAFRTQKGLNRARLNGVKLGRPLGATKISMKVAQVSKLCQTKGMSISKACKEVGCNPRTYYRHTSKT